VSRSTGHFAVAETDACVLSHVGSTCCVAATTARQVLWALQLLRHVIAAAWQGWPA
jgi:hypothetical protein